MERRRRLNISALLGLLGAIALFVLVVITVVGLTFYAVNRPTLVVEIRGPIYQGIENAVGVAGGENKFLKMQYGGFLRGGAGAGGLGAPQLFASSAQQFAELVPPGEPIYTWWETAGEPVKQTYWAFIENRAGLLVWEQTYWPGRYAYSCKFKHIDYAVGEIVYALSNSYGCGDPKLPWYRKEYPLE